MSSNEDTPVAGQEQDVNDVEELIQEGGAAFFEDRLPSPTKPRLPSFKKESPEASQLPEPPAPKSPSPEHRPDAFSVAITRKDGQVMPPNSRLFMGNLASERTHAQEIAQIFTQYGNILEISLKGSYGFVQFDNADSCRNAIVGENRRLVGDLKLDLKTSKDKSKSQGSTQSDREDRGGRSHAVSSRERENRSRPYERDRRGSNDAYAYRSRQSHSPPPPDRIPPRRYGNNVPELQLVVLGEVDRVFISDVETHFDRERVHMDLIRLSERAPLHEFVNMWKQEGVIAVMFLERRRQREGQLAAQIYTLSGSVNEYDKLSLQQATTLLFQERDFRRRPSTMIPQQSQLPQQQNQLAAMIAQLIAQSQAQGTPIDPNTLLMLTNAASGGQQPPPMPMQSQNQRNPPSMTLHSQNQMNAPPMPMHSQSQINGGFNSGMYPPVPQTMVNPMMPQMSNPMLPPMNNQRMTQMNSNQGMQMHQQSNNFRPHMHMQMPPMIPQQQQQGPVGPSSVQEMLNQLNASNKILQSINQTQK